MPEKLTSVSDLTKREREKQYNAERAADQAFYWSRQWTALRMQTMCRYPICQQCNKAASEHVHHVIDRKACPERALDEKNVIALCASCHNRITAQGHRRKGEQVPRKFGENVNG